MSISLHSVIGTIGVTLIVGAYMLLTMRKLSSTSLTYSLFNALGAFLIIVSLTVDFNFAALLIEAFWLGISVYGIYRWLSNRNARPASANSSSESDN